MKKKIDLVIKGATITVVVDGYGMIELPQMKFTTAQLKAIAVGVNRELRKSTMKEDWV